MTGDSEALDSLVNPGAGLWAAGDESWDVAYRELAVLDGVDGVEGADRIWGENTGAGALDPRRNKDFGASSEGTALSVESVVEGSCGGAGKEDPEGLRNWDWEWE